MRRTEEIAFVTLANHSILVTGGTGSFGKAFVRTVLTRYPDVKRARHLLARRAQAVRDGAGVLRREHRGLRYFIGDVRDERAPAPRAGGHRLRRPRRGAEAGAGRRIQPVRVHQDQRPRRAEPDRGLPRHERRSASSRCRPTRRPRRSTSTARPSSAPTSCSSPPTTSRATATCASPSCATAT